MGRSGRSRPSDKGGGGGVKKKFGGDRAPRAPPLDPPLVWFFSKYLSKVDNNEGTMVFAYSVTQDSLGLFHFI